MSTLTRDPLGVLGPALAALLLTTACAWWAATLWSDTPLGAVLVFWVLPTWLAIPLRGVMVSRAASAAGAELSATRWALVESAVQLAVSLALLACVVPGMAGATWLATHRFPELGGVVLGLGCLVGVLAAWLVRGLLGMTPHHASTHTDLRTGLEEGWSSWPSISLTWLGGGLLFFAGTCLFGVGGLVTFPVADLALLHRHLGGPA